MLQRQTIALFKMELIFNKLNYYFRNQLQLGVLDLEIGRWLVAPNIANIPYLKAENAQGRHIIVRPHLSIMPYYLMIDDISFELVHKHHQDKSGVWKPGRLVVETSPANYQVWIRLSTPLSLADKRYCLKKFRSDPGADPNMRWGRCPGFRNRKSKYKDKQGGYPLSRLIWIDWKKEAVPTMKQQAAKGRKCLFPPQPLGGVCHHKRIKRSNYEKGDESATDFAYILALIRRGYHESEIRNRILLERKNWLNHGNELKMKSYLDTTIKKAWSILKQDDSVLLS